MLYRLVRLEHLVRGVNPFVRRRGVVAALEVGPRKYPGRTAAQAFSRLSRQVGPLVTAARENAKPAKISQSDLSEPRPTAQQERAAATTFQHQVQSLMVDDLFWRPHLSRPEFRERSKKFTQRASAATFPIAEVRP